MQSINYSDFRSQLAKTLDQVNDNHTPIMVTRQNGKPAVVMSVEDYRSYEETSYLMSSTANASRLNAAIAEIEDGGSQTHELIEE